MDTLSPFAVRALCGAVLSVGISYSGLRKNKLDTSGAISALFIGYVTEEGEGRERGGREEGEGSERGGRGKRYQGGVSEGG